VACRSDGLNNRSVVCRSIFSYLAQAREFTDREQRSVDLPTVENLGFAVCPHTIAFQLHRSTAAMADLLAPRAADQLALPHLPWEHFHPLYGHPSGRCISMRTTRSAIAAITRRGMISVRGGRLQLLPQPHCFWPTWRARRSHKRAGRGVMCHRLGWFGALPRILVQFDLPAAAPTTWPRSGLWVPFGGRLNTRRTQIPVLIGGTGQKRTLRLGIRIRHLAALFPTTQRTRTHRCRPIAGARPSSATQPHRMGLGIEPTLGHDLDHYAADYAALGCT